FNPGRQRAQVGKQAADHRAAYQCVGRLPPLVGALRPRVAGHLRRAGRNRALRCRCIKSYAAQERKGRGAEALHRKCRGLPTLSQRPLLLVEIDTGRLSQEPRILSAGGRSRSELRPGILGTEQLFRLRFSLWICAAGDWLAHNDLAGISMVYYRDAEATEREARRAVELNPKFQEIHYLYSNYLLTKGQFDAAIGEAQKAVELDPLSVRVSNNLAFCYYLARRYDEAVAQFEQALELDEHNPMVHEGLADALEQKGHF